jgi:hypothetical protein
MEKTVMINVIALSMRKVTAPADMIAYGKERVPTPIVHAAKFAAAAI